MYFVFQLEFNSNKGYIASLIKAYAKEIGIEIELYQNGQVITFLAKSDDDRLESFLKGLDNTLPASIYFGESRHAFVDSKPNLPLFRESRTPLNIAPCPNCQKEMFDVSSPRYYYPFTSCNHCGSAYPFLENYPFIRENTTMKFFKLCSSCQEELRSNPFRENYPLISCIECGINLKMIDKKSQRYANDKGSYRKLFEISAKALDRGKTILFKTLNGYRKFFKPKVTNSRESILMVTSANRLNSHLMMVTQEFNTLLSIERPILRVSTKSRELKEIYGSTLLVKYPDEGVSMLLAKELLNLGLDYISYIETDSREDSDFVVDFDIPISTQKDIRVFINQDTKFIVSGERTVFPMVIDKRFNIVSIANNLSAVGVNSVTIIDNIDRFEEIRGRGVNILDSEDYSSGHRNERLFFHYQGSMLSILAEHNHIGKKAIGVHFDKSLYFLYYNTKEVISVVPPNPFDTDKIFEHISNLRDGSDRLVANYKKLFPQSVKEIESLRGESDIFKVTAIILEIKDMSFDGISAKALEFMGKGGISIDTHIKDNRFDNYAFLASIMSYKVAGVGVELICYSIFESFGDYISDISSQLLEKTGSKSITFTGEAFANQAIFARLERGLGSKELLFPKNLPISSECEVYGGLFI